MAPAETSGPDRVEQPARGAVPRRTVLAAGAVVPAAAAGLLVPAGGAAATPRHRPARELRDLDSLTIPAIQVYLARGRFSAVDLTDAYLARIDEVDELVHAVIVLDPTAREQAAASDRRRRRGRIRGPLDGIPVLLKDNIDTKGLQTTAGSRALLGTPPSRDAAIVTRLRDAGAVILGKANLSEWANFRADFATSGWSGVGGQTNNPYVLDRNPSGSSSGSAAGVAASLAQVAIGTETNGSIVAPSGACGVVGMKPSLGLVSRTGIVPITAEQDTAGPIGRHVVDVAVTLSALVGRDRADRATSAAPDWLPRDLSAALSRVSLRGKRIGIWRQAGVDAETDAVVERAVAVMKRAGAKVIDVELDSGESGNLSFTAMKSEFVRDLEAYLSTRRRQERTLAELVDFNETDPIELSLFDQNLFLTCLDVPDSDDPAIVAARDEARSLAQDAIDGLLAEHRLDAIASPANSPAWRTEYGEGDAYLLGSSGAAAVAGYPNLCVPAGYSGELPVGISFIGGRFQDLSILVLGAAFEKAAKARRAPELIPTID